MNIRKKIKIGSLALIIMNKNGLLNKQIISYDMYMINTAPLLFKYIY